MSFPMPGMFQPTMDPEEVDKKIFELQAVENWLKMNLSFVQMTVKTLEMQRSALQSLKDSAKGNQVSARAVRINATTSPPVFTVSRRARTIGPVDATRSRRACRWRQSRRC